MLTLTADVCFGIWLVMCNTTWNGFAGAFYMDFLSFIATSFFTLCVCVFFCSFFSCSQLLLPLRPLCDGNISSAFSLTLDSLLDFLQFISQRLSVFRWMRTPYMPISLSLPLDGCAQCTSFPSKLYHLLGAKDMCTHSTLYVHFKRIQFMFENVKYSFCSSSSSSFSPSPSDVYCLPGLFFSTALIYSEHFLIFAMCVCVLAVARLLHFNLN